jgi:hypothetical protein
MKSLLVGAALALFCSPVLADRVPGSGLYAIWYGRNTDLLKLPFLSGGQAVTQWRMVEPEEGRFDFSSIDRQLAPLHERGLKATVQINGNRKPLYLFSKVPYHPDKLSHQVADKQGTLMFWHPAHAAAHQRLIRAVGTYLKTSRYREAVLGVRLNFNAFGTEHHHLPKGEARQASSWTTPPGATPGTDWSSKEVQAYQAMVFREYIAQISPHAYVFVRNGLPKDIAKEYGEDFASGRLGWFHTSSEAEPRAGSEWRYQRFHTECRPGTTIAYAEPWASAWGHHGTKADDRACSPPQWNYWRLLLDLHNGVSFIALYSADLRVAQTGTYRYGKFGQLHDDKEAGVDYQAEFRLAFEFAARYAGYHASPKSSPGAWCAFRGNGLVREANGRPEKARKLKLYTGDYTFLMERLPDTSMALGTIGPEDQRFGGWARRLEPSGAMTLRLDPAFATSLAKQRAIVRVVYLGGEESTGAVQGAGQSLQLKPTTSKRWQTAAFPIHSWHGDTLRITAGEASLVLHMVEVLRNPE